MLTLNQQDDKYEDSNKYDIKEKKCGIKVEQLKPVEEMGVFLPTTFRSLAIRHS